MTVREVMCLCMWCCCDALRHSFRIYSLHSVWSFRCSNVTKVSAVSDDFDVVHLHCSLYSFSFSDVMQFCHIVCSFRYSYVVCSSVCSFRCSDVLHNCQMLWCALLWQCLQFPNLLGYAHLPQHLESQILCWCALLLVCCCFTCSAVVQCYCSVCHFRCSDIVHYYPVCEVSYCPTLCVITTVSVVSSASTSFTVTTVCRFRCANAVHSYCSAYRF